MIKKLSLSLAATAFVFCASAQNSQQSSAATISPAGRTTVVVPFSPRLYNNQDSRKMCEVSGMEYHQLGNYIRESFDSVLNAQMRDSINVIRLISSTTSGTANELETIYNISKYQFADRPKALEDKSKFAMIRDQRAPKAKPASSAKGNGIHNGEIVTQRVDNTNRFMNVQFDDAEYIQSIIQKYGAKYFLFITQFDILGDYSNPYLVGEMRYPRTIKVHYSIFSADGTFITGDFESYQFFAYENNITEIVRNYFPTIAKNIAHKLPR